MISNHEQLSRNHESWAALEVHEDPSNNGGYFCRCPVDGCQFETERENFKGSARLRLGEHVDEKMREEL